MPRTTRRSAPSSAGASPGSLRTRPGVPMDDLEAIKQLKGRYCRTMDTKDWAGMRQVFTDDVTMDTTQSGGNVVTGADEFMEFLVATIGEVVTVHQCHTPEIDVTSP